LAAVEGVVLLVAGRKECLLAGRELTFKRRKEDSLC